MQIYVFNTSATFHVPVQEHKDILLPASVSVQSFLFSDSLYVFIMIYGLYAHLYAHGVMNGQLV